MIKLVSSADNLGSKHRDNTSESLLTDLTNALAAFFFSEELSLSSDSLEDDSIEETKTPSPEHIVPESATMQQINRTHQHQHQNQQRQQHQHRQQAQLGSNNTYNFKVKTEPMGHHHMELKSDENLDDGLVENAAKELFGSDLLFSQEDLHTDEFWNELIDTSENSSLNQHKVMLREDLEELESSIIKVERESPSSPFFSSTIHQSTLTGF